VAEQSLQQQSKLAALGQMSAAVSHELNQPLAAMRTYLAGSRLLLQRKRHEEAESSFQRVEDLLDRMGALTRQLKSFARKSEDDLQAIDLRNSLKASLSLMSPQLGSREIKITRSVPEVPATVMADELRVEQIIVNLLRNALDAMKDVDEPHLDILLTLGDTVILSVKDNGDGIKDPEQLFEPFYTTKKPGEGIGLGLAISAGIASDLGGALTARNSERGGAVFELQLPRLDENALAAQ
jgi:two-component system C4-dicarboxylate transport sensor histidine kinase DctB